MEYFEINDSIKENLPFFFNYIERIKIRRQNVLDIKLARSYSLLGRIP